MERSCPLCGMEGIKKYFDKNSIPYHRCASCRFLFSGQEQNPNLQNSTIDQFEPAYLSFLEESTEDKYNFNNILNSLSRYKVLKGMRVLDIGTGTGKLVHFLREQNINAFGLEPSLVLYKHYLSKDPFFFLTDLRGLTSSISNVKYDVVIISDVLEHIQEPHPFFRDLSLILNPGALVYISTPDAESFLARLLGKHWHYINKYHFSFFSRKTITEITKPYGLKELDFSHITRLRSIGYIFQYFTDFVAGSRNLHIPSYWDRWVIPVNIGDLMQTIYQYEQA
jgi:2-polyprenyl-3-methyl-5-hydroxy-6-metoxy-1,4-benzoquinol methylase